MTPYSASMCAQPSDPPVISVAFVSYVYPCAVIPIRACRGCRHLPLNPSKTQSHSSFISFSLLALRLSCCARSFLLPVPPLLLRPPVLRSLSPPGSPLLVPVSSVSSPRRPAVALRSPLLAAFVVVVVPLPSPLALCGPSIAPTVRPVSVCLRSPPRGGWRRGEGKHERRCQ